MKHRRKKEAPPAGPEHTRLPGERAQLDRAVLAALASGARSEPALASKVKASELQVRLSCARLISQKLVWVQADEYSLASAPTAEPAAAPATEPATSPSASPARAKRRALGETLPLFG